MIFRSIERSVFGVNGIQALFLILAWTTLGVHALGDDQDPQSTLFIKYTTADYDFFTHRKNYVTDLLDLAMQKSGETYRMVPVNLPPLTETRSVHYLQKGIYSVHWLNTSAKLEDKLLPVRIPLFKGLIGWRLLLIRKADADAFSNVQSLDNLKQFRLLQGDDWPDTPVLKKNGLNVVTSTDIVTLFKMLARGRGDAFPRSAMEVWEELKAYANLDLAVEDHLAIYYPAAYYFFVTKDSVPLRNALEKGMNIAVSDGSFDELFFRYFGDIVSRAHLHQRRIITLSNPYLPEQTPLERKELWVDINDDRMRPSLPDDDAPAALDNNQ